MRKESAAGYWLVVVDNSIVFCCLTPEMAFRIGCLTRHAAGSQQPVLAIPAALAS
jgi:hypothetical protein